jgi:4-aminobutyrate aminotransferase-like enzyme
MVGAEIRSPDNKPDKHAAKTIVQHCLDSGLLLLTCGTWDNTVRWIPPLNVEESQVNKALSIFGDALSH